MIDEFFATLKRQQWPPLGWALAVACLLLLFIAVQDDGVGLVRPSAIEHGFVSIRDCTLALNGRLHIRSRYGLRVHVLLRQPGAPKENRRDRRRTTNAPYATT